jgi:hypothetical protein
VSSNVFMCRRLNVRSCVYVQEAQCPLMCLCAGGLMSADVFMCRRLSVR